MKLRHTSVVVLLSVLWFIIHKTIVTTSHEPNELAFSHLTTKVGEALVLVVINSSQEFVLGTNGIES